MVGKKTWHRQQFCLYGIKWELWGLFRLLLNQIQAQRLQDRSRNWATSPASHQGINSLLLHLNPFPKGWRELQTLDLLVSSPSQRRLDHHPQFLYCQYSEKTIPIEFSHPNTIGLLDQNLPTAAGAYGVIYLHLGRWGISSDAEVDATYKAFPRWPTCVS